MLFVRFIIVSPRRFLWFSNATVLMPCWSMPVSSAASGFMSTFQDDGAIAGTWLVRIAEAGRVNRLGRTIRRRRWTDGCRRVRIAQRASNSGTRRRRGLLLMEGARGRASGVVVITFFGTGLTISARRALTETATPQGVTSKCVQTGVTWAGQQHAQAADRRQRKHGRRKPVCPAAEFCHRVAPNVSSAPVRENRLALRRLARRHGAFAEAIAHPAATRLPIGRPRTNSMETPSAVRRARCCRSATAFSPTPQA